MHNVYMAEALRLAALAIGRTSPNPPVGAVLVRDGVVVGSGHTQPAGSWHAERMALNEAGERASGATLYVTLEPCCHTGRTPPCTEAIIEAGVAEVVVSTIDPNPRVAGRGIRQLEDAGIKVSIGLDEEESRLLIAGFAHWIRSGRPMVSAKFATSLDGKIATASGDSRWITGEAARERSHVFRDRVDAIVVGIGTALADDPALTARPGGLPPADGRQPIRVIVDSHLRLPPAAKVLRQPGQMLIAHAATHPERAAALRLAGAELLALPGDGRVDLHALITELGLLGALEVLIEGGSTLLGAAFDADLVDRVYAYIAPMVLGGEAATTAVAGQGAASIPAAWRVRSPRIERLGDDVLIWGNLAGRDL